MKIIILAVGRLKESFWSAAEEEYVGRIRHYAQLEVRELKDDGALVAALPVRGRVVALDGRGEVLSSEEIAKKIIGAAELQGGNAPLCFALGGADGLPESVHKRAERSLAFGRITLPHRLARIVLLEQIYRSYAILRGEPYHK